MDYPLTLWLSSPRIVPLHRLRLPRPPVLPVLELRPEQNEPAAVERGRQADLDPAGNSHHRWVWVVGKTHIFTAGLPFCLCLTFHCLSATFPLPFA